MQNQGLDMSMLVVGLTLLGAFALAFLGRRHARHLGSTQLSEYRFNRWLVGLSAGEVRLAGSETKQPSCDLTYDLWRSSNLVVAVDFGGGYSKRTFGEAPWKENRSYG
jgi:hypothetical protein